MAEFVVPLRKEIKDILTTSQARCVKIRQGM